MTSGVILGFFLLLYLIISSDLLQINNYMVFNSNRQMVTINRINK